MWICLCISSERELACAARVLNQQCGQMVALRVTQLLWRFASSPQSCRSDKTGKSTTAFSIPGTAGSTPCMMWLTASETAASWVRKAGMALALPSYLILLPGRTPALGRHPALRPQQGPSAHPRQTSRSIEPLWSFGKPQEKSRRRGNRTWGPKTPSPETRFLGVSRQNTSLETKLYPRESFRSQHHSTELKFIFAKSAKTITVLGPYPQTVSPSEISLHNINITQCTDQRRLWLVKH